MHTSESQIEGLASKLLHDAGAAPSVSAIQIAAPQGLRVFMPGNQQQRAHDVLGAVLVIPESTDLLAIEEATAVQLGAWWFAHEMHASASALQARWLGRAIMLPAAAFVEQVQRYGDSVDALQRVNTFASASLILERLQDEAIAAPTQRTHLRLVARA